MMTHKDELIAALSDPKLPNVLIRYLLKIINNYNAAKNCKYIYSPIGKAMYDAWHEYRKTYEIGGDQQ